MATKKSTNKTAHVLSLLAKPEETAAPAAAVSSGLASRLSTCAVLLVLFFVAIFSGSPSHTLSLRRGENDIDHLLKIQRRF